MANRKQTSFEDRFWSKVKKADGCWEWQASLYSNGYGYFRIKAHQAGIAHRIAYLLVKGEIPQGKLVLHSCDNRKCVNPEHLRVGTAHDNNLEAYMKNRHASGEDHYKAKFSVDEVKQFRASPKTIYRLAKENNVMSSTMGAIIHGRSYKERGVYSSQM